MGRIRTVKPEFTQDEELSVLHPETHLLAAGLLCYADDYGYFNANPGLVLANVFPLRELSGNIPEMLRSLAEIGYLRMGTAPDGKRFGLIVKFSTHQKISHKTPSKISGLGIVWDDSGTTPENTGEIPEDTEKLRNVSALNGEQGKEEEQGSNVITPEMITRSVLTELGISGRELAVVLDEVCRSQIKLYDTPGELRDALVEAWRDYDTSRPSMTQYTKRPVNFFGDGDWRNKTGWPWKDGKQPAAITGRVYVNA